MPAHELEVLRQGLWASLTGGWYYDPHADYFANTFHTYTWLLFLCLPLGLHLLLPPGAFISYGWGIYCAFIFLFFTTLNLVNYRLHRMFDTSQVQEDSVSEEEDETSDLGLGGVTASASGAGAEKEDGEAVTSLGAGNGDKVPSSRRSSARGTRGSGRGASGGGDASSSNLYANVTTRRRKSSRRNNPGGCMIRGESVVVEEEGIEMRQFGTLDSGGVEEVGASSPAATADDIDDDALTTGDWDMAMDSVGKLSSMDGRLGGGGGGPSAGVGANANEPLSGFMTVMIEAEGALGRCTVSDSGGVAGSGGGGGSVDKSHSVTPPVRCSSRNSLADLRVDVHHRRDSVGGIPPSGSGVSAIESSAVPDISASFAAALLSSSSKELEETPEAALETNISWPYCSECESSAAVAALPSTTVAITADVSSQPNVKPTDAEVKHLCPLHKQLFNGGAGRWRCDPQSLIDKYLREAGKTNYHSSLSNEEKDATKTGAGAFGSYHGFTATPSVEDGKEEEGASRSRSESHVAAAALAADADANPLAANAAGPKGKSEVDGAEAVSQSMTSTADTNSYGVEGNVGESTVTLPPPPSASSRSLDLGGCRRVNEFETSDNRSSYLREKSESVDETLGKLDVPAASGESLLMRQCPLLSSQQQQDLATAAPLHLDHIEALQSSEENLRKNNVAEKTATTAAVSETALRPAIPASTSDSSIATILQELFAERRSRSSSLKGDHNTNSKQQQQQQQQQYRNRHQNKRYTKRASESGGGKKSVSNPASSASAKDGHQQRILTTETLNPGDWFTLNIFSSSSNEEMTDPAVGSLTTTTHGGAEPPTSTISSATSDR